MATGGEVNGNGTEISKWKVEMERQTGDNGQGSEASLRGEGVAHRLSFRHDPPR